MSSHKLSDQTDRPNKKQKLQRESLDHAQDCEDSTCEGCAEGEVEIVFKEGQTPNPAELYRLAKQEAETEAPNEHGGGVVNRLFELSLKGFESNSSPSEEEKIQHANCLTAFGYYLPYQEYIDKAIEKYLDILKENKSSPKGLLGLGDAFLSTAKILREKESISTQNDSDSEEEDNIRDIPSDEKKAYTKAFEHFNEALDVLEKAQDKSLAEDLVDASNVILEYCSVDRNYTAENNHDTFALDNAKRMLNQAFKINAEFFDKNLFAHSLWGSCALNIARSLDQEVEANISKIQENLNEAISHLSEVNQMFSNDSEGGNHSMSANHLELLGQAYIFKSTLAEEDDEAEQSYDMGVEMFTKAFALDPENENLRVQLETLGASGNTEDEDEEEEPSDCKGKGKEVLKE